MGVVHTERRNEDPLRPHVVPEGDLQVRVPAAGFLPADGADGAGYYDPNAVNNDYEGTLEEARTLLMSAGYRFADDGTLSRETPLSFSCLTDSDSAHVAIAESVQMDLSMLGIEMGVDQRDPETFKAAAEAREYDMIQAEATAPAWDPFSMLEMWKSDSPDNLAGFGAAG